MPRVADYRATEALIFSPGDDAFTRPAFSVGNRGRRAVWGLCWLLLYRCSPRPLHAWRSFLLRCFGAQLGPDCHFYPGSRVWAPWNLRCEDHVAAADGAEIYNPSLMELGSHVILSQGSYLCGATHDYNDPEFPLTAYRMKVGAYAWICARASVGPGLTVGEGAVLGLGAIATRHLLPWTVYSGNPAVALRDRKRIFVAAYDEIATPDETAAPHEVAAPDVVAPDVAAPDVVASHAATAPNKAGGAANS